MSKQFDLPDAMIHGLASKAKTSQLAAVHPLEAAEKSHFDRAEQLDMAMLRKFQGIHAPLRLQMERKATLKVGHLPFLPRHNASYNVLTGRDETIEFEDYLGHPHEPEMVGQPHAMVERKLGLL